MTYNLIDSAQPVVLYREEKSSSKKSPQSYLVAGLTSVFIFLLVMQVGFINSAFGEDPISSPLTSPITAPEESPAPLPSVDPSPTPVIPGPSSNSNSNNGSSNGGGNSGGGNGNSAPVCNDTKPSSAPTLLSATYTGPNQITLNWSKAKDPVTYYLVSYGINANANQYGNPNVGDKNVASYAVKGLSGNTNYYFKVRAGNNCMPGEFSNVILAKTTGKFKNTPAAGFKSGVLAANQIASPKPTASPSYGMTPIVLASHNQTVFQQFFSQIFNFFQR